MSVRICKNHPGRKAVAHCEGCHIPLCEECAVLSEHPKAKGKAFCSEEHRKNWETYIDAIGERQPPPMRRPSMFSYLFWLVAGVVVVYFGLKFTGLLPESLRVF
jgi:hypothetical protein